MKMMPFSFSLAGSLGFSLAWPQPGQTASTSSGPNDVSLKMEEMPWKCLSFLQHWNLNMAFWGILRMEQVLWFCLGHLAPAALSRCGKSNPRWHSCWRSCHLSNLPKRALCSGTFFFSNFCTFREHSSTWIKGYKMLQDATSTITLKQHTPANFHTIPQPTLTWNLHKRIGQANELRIRIEIIGCCHGHESDQLLWAKLCEGPPAHRQDRLEQGNSGDAMLKFSQLMMPCKGEKFQRCRKK